MYDHHDAYEDGVVLTLFYPPSYFVQEWMKGESETGLYKR